MRHRIRHGRMVNIDQLDSAGNRVCDCVSFRKET